MHCSRYLVASPRHQEQTHSPRLKPTLCFAGLNAHPYHAYAWKQVKEPAQQLSFGTLEYSDKKNEISISAKNPFRNCDTFLSFRIGAAQPVAIYGSAPTVNHSG
jgi:hypothetical protein